MKTATKKPVKKDSKFDFKTITTVKAAFKNREIEFESIDEFEKFLETSKVPKRFHPPLLGFYKLMVAYEAVNQEKRPDYGNYSEDKYWTWHSVLASGSGFVDSYYDYGHTLTTVGSRLCTFERDHERHIAKYFEQEFIDFKLK